MVTPYRPEMSVLQGLVLRDALMLTYTYFSSRSLRRRTLSGYRPYMPALPNANLPTAAVQFSPAAPSHFWNPRNAFHAHIFVINHTLKPVNQITIIYEYLSFSRRICSNRLRHELANSPA